MNIRNKGLFFGPKNSLHFLTGILGENMEQSQLIDLIGTLTADEKEQIRQYASIPYFNNSKLKNFVLPLFDICLKHVEHGSDESLEKKAVFNKLFSGKIFVDGKLEKVMVEVNKIVRTVLLMRYYLSEKNEFQQLFDYSKIIRAKGLKLRYQQIISRLRKMQQEKPWKNADYFQEQFILQYAIHR